jgi:hypothetical protein
MGKVNYNEDWSGTEKELSSCTSVAFHCLILKTIENRTLKDLVLDTKLAYLKYVYDSHSQIIK